MRQTLSVSVDEETARKVNARGRGRYIDRLVKKDETTEKEVKT